MDIKTFALCVTGCLGLVAQGYAANVISSGALRFTGSIVEPSCHGVAGNRGVWLEECPPWTIDSHIDVQRLESQGGAVHIVSGSTIGGTSRSYKLVDVNGKQLSRGSFVVIVTSP